MDVTQNPSNTASRVALGKRRDPAYQQISAYVRTDLYDAIRHELIGKPEDFSDLLETWMRRHLNEGAPGTKVWGA